MRPTARRARRWVRASLPDPRFGRWLLASTTRNWRGSLAGLISAWFNVPFIIFLAGVGAVMGGIGGTLSGTVAGPGGLARLDALLSWVLPLPFRVENLLPTAAFQIGGIVGGLIGVVTGAIVLAWQGFFGFWALLYEGDPSWPLLVAVGQVVTAVAVGFGYTAYSVALEGWRLRLSGARRPSRREAELLAPLVREAAQRLGCRSIPLLCIDDSREPNASAGARHIVVSRGLLEFLRYDHTALAGVIAHEVAHWKRGDAIATAWSKGIALPLFLVYELAVKAHNAARWRPLQFLVRIVLWSVVATIKFVVMPAHAAGQRRQEYAADAAAKAAGYGEGLYRALALRGHGFDGARSGWDAAVLATHPHTELRLERLEGAGRDYHLPYDSVPPEPVTALPRSRRRGPDKD